VQWQLITLDMMLSLSTSSDSDVEESQLISR